jgi:uncharacterized protein
VKLIVAEIKEAPEAVAFEESVDELNALLRHRVQDYVATTPIGVEIVYYRAGLDVFVSGALWAHLKGTCARCLVDYPVRLARDFALVLVPLSASMVEAADGELSAEDLALSFYTGEKIDLSPLVREQLLLSLPTRPLCTPGCRGLCAMCGQSLNEGDCGCVVERGDPRLAVFRTLKVGRSG